MQATGQSRSAQKHQAILEAATTVFLEKGYAGASMDDVARLAAVSKQTVYKHFADKERLFAEIIMATNDRVDGMIGLVAAVSGKPESLEADLVRLARGLLLALTQPQVLRLRRLIIANADTFPDVGSAWFEGGFQRGMATLAGALERLAEAGRLRVEDPMLAANHFSGLLLWSPVNQAMFTGAYEPDEAEVDRRATSAVRAFLAAYGTG